METYIDKKYAITNRTICSYNGAEKDLVIPSRFALIVPDTLGKGAFFHNTDLFSVSIPACIRSINAYCFDQCYFLRRVEFQGNVETIQDHAFSTIIHERLREIVFSHLHVTEAEYLHLKRHCVLKQDGMWITEYIPWYLLPKGLQQNWLESAVYTELSSGDPGTHIPQGIHALMPYPAGDAMQEQQTVLKYLPHADQEYLSSASEAYNDTLLQTSQKKKSFLSAYFCFEDARTEATEDGYYISAELRIGHYFWPSVKRIVCSGKEYYVYRRHILTDSSEIEYIREDAGVYTLSGPVTDPKEEKAVYAKYKLLSTLA